MGWTDKNLEEKSKCKTKAINFRTLTSSFRLQLPKACKRNRMDEITINYILHGLAHELLHSRLLAVHLPYISNIEHGGQTGKWLLCIFAKNKLWCCVYSTCYMISTRFFS